MLNKSWIIATVCTVATGYSADAYRPPANANITQKIDGSSYRVRIRGDDVVVASKAVLVMQSLDLRDKMRRAVKEATGCDLVDDTWLETKLGGKLRCPD